ncbi:MAG: glycosyltransferase family 2 protein [Candidatus Dormibacteraeota bacterium]|nr:glycosyltransferase family 2 protein [Candidatus Dormibacteraeota bacterium]
METRPLISAIVCTRDRPETLGKTLESLVGQRHPRYEILVVDQGRTDAGERVVRHWQTVHPGLRHLRLQQAGLSRAYNAGIAAAQAPILAFTDDDCVAPEGWLGAIEGAFQAHPDVSLLYGQVLVAPELAAKENRDGVTPALTIPERRVLCRRRGFQVFGMGADFAARRTLFERVGGFDEILGGGAPLQSTQDFDFGYRVFRSGEATLLEPDVVVHHYGFRSHRDLPDTIRSYGVGVGGFYLKHVRAGDLYAARLLLGHLTQYGARWLKRTLARQSGRLEGVYLRNIASGARRSFAFRVDRRLRLYRAR